MLIVKCKIQIELGIRYYEAVRISMVQNLFFKYWQTEPPANEVAGR